MNIFMHILVIAMIIFSGKMLRLWNNSLNIFKALNIWLQITLRKPVARYTPRSSVYAKPMCFT